MRRLGHSGDEVVPSIFPPPISAPIIGTLGKLNAQGVQGQQLPLMIMYLKIGNKQAASLTDIKPRNALEGFEASTWLRLTVRPHALTPLDPTPFAATHTRTRTCTCARNAGGGAWRDGSSPSECTDPCPYTKIMFLSFRARASAGEFKFSLPNEAKFMHCNFRQHS